MMGMGWPMANVVPTSLHPALLKLVTYTFCTKDLGFESDMPTMTSNTFVTARAPN